MHRASSISRSPRSRACQTLSLCQYGNHQLRVPCKWREIRHYIWGKNTFHDAAVEEGALNFKIIMYIPPYRAFATSIGVPSHLAVNYKLAHLWFNNPHSLNSSLAVHSYLAWPNKFLVEKWRLSLFLPLSSPWLCLPQLTSRQSDTTLTTSVSMDIISRKWTTNSAHSDT